MAAKMLTALGDSFTEGFGDPAPAGCLHGWVSRYTALMNLRRHHVCNLGRYGATTERVVDTQLPQAIRNRAPLMVAIAGVNDLLGSYDPQRLRRNLTTLFGRLSDVHTTVVTATYPDIPVNLPVSDEQRRTLRQRFAEGNEMLERIAEDSGVLVVDLHRPAMWHEPAVWSDDGLHPGSLGHEYFAEKLVSLVSRTNQLVDA